MAEEQIRAILHDCLDRHSLEAAAAEHRVGRVPLGESSVIVSVSAAHREEAFSGARDAIDRIKAEAPIWKREVEVIGDGESGHWVEGAAPPTRETGVEMEAMTACAVAALTVYDMVKGLERGVRIEAVQLVEKSGGRSGTWRRNEADAEADEGREI